MMRGRFPIQRFSCENFNIPMADKTIHFAYTICTFKSNQLRLSLMVKFGIVTENKNLKTVLTGAGYAGGGATGEGSLGAGGPG
jgi:hypothetical protein